MGGWRGENVISGESYAGKTSQDLCSKTEARVACAKNSNEGSLVERSEGKRKEKRWGPELTAFYSELHCTPRKTLRRRGTWSYLKVSAGHSDRCVEKGLRVGVTRVESGNSPTVMD